MSVPPPKIEVRALSKVYGRSGAEALQRVAAGMSRDRILQELHCLVAVNDVSFSVAEREIFVVMGLSGSGKSTLIRCINRLVEPTSGHVLLDGQDILTLSPEQLRRIRLDKIAMVFQHYALFPHMTVSANVEYGLKIRGMARRERRERAREALDSVGLGTWGQATPDQLSGGMRQRVGLARALVMDPDVLLMDEPFGALDPLIRRDMQQELLRIKGRFRGAIIFITHDLHEALTLGDRIAIMRDGRFAQLGAGSEIVSAPADEYVAAFTRDVDRGRVLRVGSVMRVAETLPLRQTSLPDAKAFMRSRRLGWLYLSDEAGRPSGLLSQQDLLHADPDNTADLHRVMRLDFPCVGLSATLASVFGLCDGDRPIAVVDESGRLCGVLTPGDVLTAMADPRTAGERPGAAAAHMVPAAQAPALASSP